MKEKIIGFLGYLLISALKSTYKFKFYHEDRRDQILESHQNRALFAVWHQSIIALLTAHIGRKVVAIVSLSKDGEMMSQALKRLGFKAARGSSSRGGQAALDNLIQEINNGYCGAITVDGPRGPARKVKRGIIFASKATNLPILPVAQIAESEWIFKSWDRFKLPKPFTTIHIFYGEPIDLTDYNIESEGLQEITERIEKSLYVARAQLRRTIKTK